MIDLVLLGQVNISAMHLDGFTINTLCDGEFNEQLKF